MTIEQDISLDLDSSSSSTSTLTLGSIIFTCVIATTIVGLVSIYIRHRLLEREAQRLTNGMPVKPFSLITPLIGDVELFLSSDLYQDKHHPIYGRIFTTYVLGEYYIVIQDPSLFDQVYYENAKNIKFEWTESINKMFGNRGILNAIGDDHKRQRKMILNYVAVPSLNRLFPGFVQIFNKHINNWVDKTKDGSYIDILPELGKAVWEAISFVILGDDLPQNIVDELREVMDIFGKGVLALPINLPFTTLGKSMSAGKRFRQLIINEYKRRQLMPDQGYNRKDFFQTLINQTCNEGHPEGFNIDTAISVIWASLDTTKGTSLQMINVMIEHSKEWERVKNEIYNKFGNDGILSPDVTYSTLCEQIPYISACVKEVMRYIGFPMMGLRKVINTFEISLQNGKKYTIPSESRIYSSYYNYQKDEESIIFSNAASFIPERYMGSNAEDKISKYKSSYASFGLGDRQCPGSPFARLEMEVIMALMSKYKWVRKERPRDWVNLPFPMPANGYWIKAIPIN